MLYFSKFERDHLWSKLRQCGDALQRSFDAANQEEAIDAAYLSRQLSRVVRYAEDANGVVRQVIDQVYRAREEDRPS